MNSPNIQGTVLLQVLIYAKRCSRGSLVASLGIFHKATSILLGCQFISPIPSTMPSLSRARNASQKLFGNIVIKLPDFCHAVEFDGE
ncbi:hypothetical protein GOP47_0018544 [Adiantum capillus-veneris]|uniref:Uncharacterized protein n=1 Tax=Adiantum capillus-veneris TaxID=13818 RepID=A0A9D4Z9P4_ADICA|nr:hypothetical protein GOP47_0018544 [Adiantum capillus-veneris]